MHGARPVAVAALSAALALASCTSGAHRPAAAPAPTAPASSSSAPAPIASPTTSPTTSVISPTAIPVTSRIRQHAPPRHPTRRPSPRPRRSRAHRPSAQPAAQLPLHYPTDGAQQVLTVVAGAESDTQGSLRAWRRVHGGWRPVGPAVPAWLGSDGMTAHPSESLSAVPMGSHTLTQAFGHDPDPGTALPYRHTTPADWWISEAGPYYNTEQHCAADCPFTQGAPNEHLYYEVPYYDYAVVIDYNTRNSPTGVRQGAGSAFFLHVDVGQPTAGCVAIDRTQLVRILRWLRPGAHPRILIGTS